MSSNTIIISTNFTTLETTTEQTLLRKSANGVNCVWKVVGREIANPNNGEIEKRYFSIWRFDWYALRTKGVVGLKINIKFEKYAKSTAELSVDAPTPFVYSIKLKFTAEIELIQRTLDISTIESNFSLSDSTDVVLIAEGKKMHVNKALLSHHSVYFRFLLNSDFKEKQRIEIPVEDVQYEDFATLLTLIQQNPISITESQAEKLLELADRFLMPAAKRHVELYLIGSKMDLIRKIELADKHRLSSLLESSVGLLDRSHFDTITGTPAYERYTADTKAELFQRLLSIF